MIPLITTNELRDRIITISKKHKLSHLGSCLSVLDLIHVSYLMKKEDEKFVLSAGHAGLALYVVMDAYNHGNVEEMLKHGIHTDVKAGIDVSTGSLGQGLPIAVGMALADRTKNVYCIISDGEMTEGSIWEALRIASENKLTNLKLMVNANGYSAYKEINIEPLKRRLRAFGWALFPCNGHDETQISRGLQMETADTPVAVFAKTRVDHYPFLEGIDAHYCTVPEDYEKA